MQVKHIRRAGVAVLGLIWLMLTAFAWFLPPKQTSETERRPLAQPPPLTGEALLSGAFMKEFESFSVDQFPVRDTFRKIKAMFHYYALGQKDNNGIYMEDGYAAKLEYPLNREAVQMAAQRLNYLYEKYLQNTDVKLYAAVIPDKGYYLAEQNGYPAMDYDAMFEIMEQNMPWAEHISLTDTLSIEDYYYTDIHWRQEKIFPVAQKLAQEMGVTPPDEKSYTSHALERPFYGVYYGQAALPMESEIMYLTENEAIAASTAYDHETGKTGAVYDMEKVSGRDMYDVYLSGSRSLLTIENSKAATERELIVFRDSFASSLIPLLLTDYAKVTLVDIRYISTEVLGNFLEFTDQDVLFLYCTTVLNSKGILR